jgi:hypothetical protein
MGKVIAEKLKFKYKYEIVNDEMVFTVVADDCAGRSEVLNKSKWVKSNKIDLFSF